MGKTKLMTPLTQGRKFNWEHHRIRVTLAKEVSNGTKNYRLWRSAGQPDTDCPLYLEITNYLVPFMQTEYDLIRNAAFLEMYGGNEEREEFYRKLRDSDENEKEEGDNVFVTALNAEEQKIEQLGSNPIAQANYIQAYLEKRVQAYLTAKDNEGLIVPDFCGALVINDLDRCLELSIDYEETMQKKEQERIALAEEENRIFCEKENTKAEQHVADAISIIRNGGVLMNVPVRIYRNKDESSYYMIVNHLLRKYNIDVPLRTQGWINSKLISVTISNGECDTIRYHRNKGARCSQKIFDCINNLIKAVTDSNI